MASPQHTPDKVSQSFIKQYYNMLSTKPEDLCRFYNDQSSFTHCFGPQAEGHVRGQQAIREKVDTLNLEGAHVDLSNGSVDAQPSVDNAVFLTVTGTIARRGDIPRPFVQSFFLATQQMIPGTFSYFVMNSVFRLLNTELTVAEEQHVPIVEKAQQVEADKGAGSMTPQKVAPVREEIVPVAPQPVIEEPENAPEIHVPEEEPVVVEEAPVVEDAAPAPAAAAGAPKSFLDAARKSLPDAPVKPAPANPRRSAPQSGEARRTAAHERESKGEAREAATSNAIHVNNISDRTRAEDLAHVFSKFGNIEKIDVPPARGFAFIFFETAASAQAALTSGEKFVLHDKSLKVEPRIASKGTGNRKNGPSKPFNTSPKNGERRDRPKDGNARRGGDNKRSGDHKHRFEHRTAAAPAAAAKN